jgi:hypothetical protein
MKTIELENEILEEHEKTQRRLNYHIEKLLSPIPISEIIFHEEMKQLCESEKKQLVQWLNLLKDENLEDIKNEYLHFMKTKRIE